MAQSPDRARPAGIELLGSPLWFPHIYVWTNIWQNMGYATIIFLAALSAVDPELHEAARVDGATNTRMLWSVVLPLSGPIIAVITLFYAVNHWNQFFNALVYIRRQELRPLQRRDDRGVEGMSRTAQGNCNSESGCYPERNEIAAPGRENKEQHTCSNSWQSHWPRCWRWAESPSPPATRKQPQVRIN